MEWKMEDGQAAPAWPAAGTKTGILVTAICSLFPSDSLCPLPVIQWLRLNQVRGQIRPKILGQKSSTHAGAGPVTNRTAIFGPRFLALLFGRCASREYPCRPCYGRKEGQKYFRRMPETYIFLSTSFCRVQLTRIIHVGCVKLAQVQGASAQAVFGADDTP